MKAGGGGGEQRPSARHGTDVGGVWTSLRGSPRAARTGEPRVPPFPKPHRAPTAAVCPWMGPAGAPAHHPARALLAPHSGPQDGPDPRAAPRLTRCPVTRAGNCRSGSLLRPRDPKSPPPPPGSSICSIRPREAGRNGTGGQSRARQREGAQQSPRRAEGGRRWETSVPAAGNGMEAPLTPKRDAGWETQRGSDRRPAQRRARRRPHGTGGPQRRACGVTPVQSQQRPCRVGTAVSGVEPRRPIDPVGSPSAARSAGAEPHAAPRGSAARALCACQGVRAHTRGA